MIELIKKNQLFYWLTGLFWLVCLLALVMMEKGDPLIFINGYHANFFDYFFYYTTYLGDGLFSVVFLVSLFLFVNMRKGAVVTLVFLVVVLVVQGLKFTFVHPRPFIYFQDAQNLYYIPWLEIHKFNSFPSGHTAQAFCFALCICFYATQKNYALLLFVLAALTGFSRMYLMQHFPVDVLVGSAIAVVLTTLCFPLLENKADFLQRPVLNQSLISFIKQNKK